MFWFILALVIGYSLGSYFPAPFIKPLVDNIISLFKKKK